MRNPYGGLESSPHQVYGVASYDLMVRPYTAQTQDATVTPLMDDRGGEFPGGPWRSGGGVFLLVNTELKHEVLKLTVPSRIALGAIERMVDQN
jgi:hypothetical protein